MFHASAVSRVRAVVGHLTPVRSSVWSSASRQSAPTRLLAGRPTALTLHAAACASSFSTAVPTAPLLPPQSARDRGRLTVVLDMDETLLHSHLAPLPTNGDPRSVDDHEDERAAEVKNKKAVDFTFEIGTNKHDKELVKSTLRPGLRAFLHALSEEFEPILFTSAMQIYAEPLLNRIDVSPATGGPDATPESLHPLWRHRLYRPATVNIGQFGFVKDVSRLGRDMKRVVLVDNSWAACVANPDNSIVVPDYLGEQEDIVLERLLAMLRDLKDQEDVRPALIQTIKLRQALADAGIKLPK